MRSCLALASLALWCPLVSARTDTVGAPGVSLTHRLIGLQWRGDRVVARIQSVFCDLRKRDGLNVWREEGAYVVVRDAARGWQYLSRQPTGRIEGVRCSRETGRLVSIKRYRRWT